MMALHMKWKKMPGHISIVLCSLLLDLAQDNFRKPSNILFAES